MFSPNKVFFISLQLQITIAFFHIDDEASISDVERQSKFELKKIFGHNFYDIINLKEGLVWKISMDQKAFKPQDYSDGFSEFGTNETYLILAKNWNLTLFYWVGMETTLEHKKHVAKYAALLFMVLKKYNWFVGYRFNFTREDEIFESESFIHALNLLKNKHEPKDAYQKVYRDYHFPLKGPNVYLLKEDQIRSGIKIPVGLGLRVLTKKVCLVVDVPAHMSILHPANVYCADGINNVVRWRAKAMVKIIRSSFITPDIVVRGCDKYKALVELLEDKQYYRKSDLPYLQDENKVIIDQDEGILLFKISIVSDNERGTTTREAVGTPVTTRDIHYRNNYILDTKSVAGIFFVYADGDDVNEIMWAIENAEEYLHDKIRALGSPIQMRITTRGMVLDFEMNFTPLRPPRYLQVQ